ncbi:hypothetical protein D3C85_1650340 [compost metagenome]
MTRMSWLTLGSAARMVGANSRSVINTLASPCSSMKAMASASRRVLRVLSTAPHIGTPKWHSYISGVLASITATVSSCPTPAAASADASRRQRA